MTPFAPSCEFVSRGFDAGATVVVSPLIALQRDQQLGFHRLTLDALKLRYREELVAGRILKYLDVIVDIQLLITLDLKLSALGPVGPFLPDIRTAPGHPLGLLMKGLRVSLAYNIDDFNASELGDDHKPLSIGWPTEYHGKIPRR